MRKQGNERVRCTGEKVNDKAIGCKNMDGARIGVLGWTTVACSMSVISKRYERHIEQIRTASRQSGTAATWTGMYLLHA